MARHNQRSLELYCFASGGATLPNTHPDSEHALDRLQARFDGNADNLLAYDIANAVIERVRVHPQRWLR